MHEAYGGVVPELASRDHIRRLVPLTPARCSSARPAKHSTIWAAVGYTEGPGLAGALLVGRRRSRTALRQRWASRRSASTTSKGTCCRRCSPARAAALSRSSRCWFPAATRSSCGCDGVGRYALLGETQDDAAGEAFDKTAQAPRPGLSGRAGAVAARRDRACRDA